MTINVYAQWANESKRKTSEWAEKKEEPRKESKYERTNSTKKNINATPPR